MDFGIFPKVGSVIRRLALLLVFGLAGLVSGAESWIRVQSAHFEILSDAPEGRAGGAITQLERIYGAIANFGLPEGPSRRTARVFLFDNQAEFADYRSPGDHLAAGFFFPGRTIDYIVTGASGPELPRILSHECVHLVLNTSGARLPHWFAEGLAELVSSAEVHNGLLEIGAPLPGRAQLLEGLSKLDLAGLLTGRPIRNPDAYAKSWALVRMLTLAPGYREHLSEFLLLVASGEAQERAINLVYGKTLDDLAADVRASLARHYELWKTQIAAPPADTKAEPIGSVEAGLALADLLEDTRSIEVADRHLTELARRAPGSPEVAAARAKLAQKQARTDDAVALYSQAIELGTRDPHVYFERAMLLRDQPDRAAQVRSDLKRAVELEPGFGEAARQLALLNVRDGFPARIPKANGGWSNPKSDHTIRGLLIELDCAGAEARFVLEVEGRKIGLRVSDPSKVPIDGVSEASILLSCGAMRPRPVTVEYRSGPAADGRSLGEITAIHFE